MLKRITYTCKKCNWKETIIEHWADLKPKRCGNKACGQGFIKDPSWLKIDRPAPDAAPEATQQVETKSTKPKKYKEDEARG